MAAAGAKRPKLGLAPHRFACLSGYGNGLGLIMIACMVLNYRFINVRMLFLSSSGIPAVAESVLGSSIIFVEHGFLLCDVYAPHV